MQATDFDKAFDDGKEDITLHVDLHSARRPNQKEDSSNDIQRTTMDFPALMVDDFDDEANR